jgi:hypothetical protein
MGLLCQSWTTDEDISKDKSSENKASYFVQRFSKETELENHNHDKVTSNI